MRNFKDQGRWKAAETGMSAPFLWLSAEHSKAVLNSF